LLPSQDARNIPRQSNPPPPPVNDADPTRNLDQTSFRNGHESGDHQQLPRPPNSNQLQNQSMKTPCASQEPVYLPPKL
jgi:hypothetical protein